jgi:hypothetical protein
VEPLRPQFFVNGVSLGARTTVQVPTGSTLSDAAGNLRIGNLSSGVAFDGIIDEVRDAAVNSTLECGAELAD